MKMMIGSYTGTIGKTTIAMLFAPLMDSAPIIAVETINETANAAGLDVEKIRGDQFRAIFKKLAMLDNVIVDVGASNIEDFLAGMTKFEDSYLEIDLFVVPVTSGHKELREAIAYIDVLSNFGIPADKIRVIFNRVDSDVEEEFSAILEYAKKTGKCIADVRAAVMENELFSMIGLKKITVTALLEDTTDYRTKAREEKNEKIRNQHLDMFTMKALARSVNNNLNAVFEVVTTK